jgi:NADH-quinone oxidoreductase subunit G
MQEGVLELLLANHPLDCPVCDKGGECPLQDQAFSNGPGESRYIEEKRHYEKPIAISDIVFLDRERCILCDRCTRFADEVAGDPLIHFNGRGNNTHITTYPDEPFSSYFSGNTVQICPVGALTAKPYRFKARPWDLSEQESTCTSCSVGCRTVVQSSRDELLRVMGVDSDPVNHGWLCDRGRFNFEAVKSSERVLQPLVRVDDVLQPATWNRALSTAADLLKEAVAVGGVQSVAVIGGARGTNEDAFAWARLGHEVLGTPNVYAQMGDGLPVGLLGLDRATIDEAASAATIVLLGPDLKEELPVLYLRLREAAEKRRSASSSSRRSRPGLTKYAWRSIGYEPGTQVGAVATALADPAIAAQLASGSVVVVAGRANLAESSAATVAALRTVSAAAPAPRCCRPSAGATWWVRCRWACAPARAASTPGARCRRRPTARSTASCWSVPTRSPTSPTPTSPAGHWPAPAASSPSTRSSPQSSSRADVVLAASAYAEKAGTTTNLEGRVSTVARQVTPPARTRPDWMIAAELAAALGSDLGYSSVEDITADIAAKVVGYESASPPRPWPPTATACSPKCRQPSTR